ncbi:AlpA family phage regulatory protein [Leclercia adecarboxylata ATCC 23216 = NBRC 102595]|nr:AlpA family phage regulatory protein [Leclercia adecarboxylata ATCC 23216 = NBRC 102595]
MTVLNSDFLYWPDVLAVTGSSKTTIRRKMANGSFPPIRKLMGRAGWPKSQIAQWIAEEKKGAGVC